MNTQTITIQGKPFQVPAPFAEGHVLKAGEAQALNQVMAENIRNNFAAAMKRAAEDKENPRELGQADLDSYAAKYEFGVRVGGARVVTDPVTSEARKLARTAITKALAAKNVKVKDLPEGKMDSLIDEALTKHPKFTEQAKIIVESRQVAVSDLAL